MNECIVCLVHSPLYFFLWYQIFQIIQTQGKEKFFAFPLLSPDHPLFWGNTGSGLSTPALGKTISLNIEFDSSWVFGLFWDLQLFLILLKWAFQKLQTSTSSYVLKRSQALFFLLGCCFLLHHWILGSSQAGSPVLVVCPTWWPSDALIQTSEMQRSRKSSYDLGKTQRRGRSHGAMGRGSGYGTRGRCTLAQWREHVYFT